MRRLAAWFGAADPVPWRTAPMEGVMSGAARTHVFLFGFPRSGTTLLEQALAGHPEVLTLEEAPTLAEPYAEFLATPEGLTRLSTLSAADARIWRSRYWSEVAARGVIPAGKVFLDKAPAGTIYLPLVAKLFPNAKVLFAVRDPRDVVLSCLRNNFQLNAMTYAFTDLAETAACYDACMAMAEVYRRVLAAGRAGGAPRGAGGDFRRGTGGDRGFPGDRGDARDGRHIGHVRAPNRAHAERGSGPGGLEHAKVCFAGAPTRSALTPVAARVGAVGGAVGVLRAGAFVRAGRAPDGRGSA